jgi:hypothetical protein
MIYGATALPAYLLALGCGEVIEAQMFNFARMLNRITTIEL